MAACKSLAFALLLGACAKAPVSTHSEQSVSPPAEPLPSASLQSPPAEPLPSASPQSPALPALTASSWIEPLTLDGALIGYVTPPLGAREPRPVVVAVHGAGDRPEWACGGWRLAAAEYPFVVCPQGLPMDAQRFAWDSERRISERVASVLNAVHARFGDHIAAGPIVYVGFSQGATLARSALLDGHDSFPAIALAEGGYNLLRDGHFLSRLRARGTSRVLIVCGSPACFATAQSVTPRLQHAGIEALSAGDPLSGHNLNQRMQVALRAAWPSLVSGLANWSGFEAHLAARRH